MLDGASLLSWSACAMLHGRSEAGQDAEIVGGPSQHGPLDLVRGGVRGLPGGRGSFVRDHGGAAGARHKGEFAVASAVIPEQVPHCVRYVPVDTVIVSDVLCLMCPGVANCWSRV